MKNFLSILFISLFIFSCNKDRNPIGTETDVCSGEYIELWGNYLDVNTITEIDLGLTGLIGVIPQHIGCFENLTYVARAVTPAWRPIRFNARFFMIDQRFVKGQLGGDGELLNLGYVPLSETKEFELPLITKRVLELVKDLVLTPPNLKKRMTVTNFKHNGTFHEMFNE